MRIMVTGCCGFIGHHLLEHFLVNTDHEIIGVDHLSYASNGFNRLRHSGCLENKRLKIFAADFTHPFTLGLRKEIGPVEVIIHMGAETHVDNSIEDPISFVKANVLGTGYVLEFARTQDRLEKFLYFSTDEVFGPAAPGKNYKEWDRYNSSNPYAATKAGGEELVLAYGNTYKIPVMVTHTMNAFGERQHPEKYIPMCIKKILNGERVVIHSDPTKRIPGSRFYVHCRNIAAAVLFLVDHAATFDKYNIVGEREVNNLALAKFIAKVLDKELKYDMVDFHSSRPGHDLRYALDGTKLYDMGWRYPKDFESSLEKTVKWYVEFKEWLNW